MLSEISRLCPTLSFSKDKLVNTAKKKKKRADSQKHEKTNGYQWLEREESEGRGVGGINYWL